MIRAAIDLGTNTCLLLVADWDVGVMHPGRVIGDFATVVRLGEGVDRERRFLPAAMQRTLECLHGYAASVRAAGARPEDTICVATSQARDASNSDEFFVRICKETGFAFAVISGDEEARRTFSGALLPGVDPQSAAVIDIGGGSTELISVQGGRSVDIGSVRFTERFFNSDPVTDSAFWACQDAIDAALESLSGWRSLLPPSTELIAVAGTATTLAAWHLSLKQYDHARVDEVVLTRGDVHRMVEELKWRTYAERLVIPCMESGRADVILAGALILWRAMEKLDFPACRVSSRGLRYGVLRDRILTS